MRSKILFSLMVIALWSCEEPFIPDTVDKPAEIVVEGYIEAGERATPPYVILTKDVPFFSTFSAEDLENTFIHDAIIEVSDGEQTTQLTELCLNELTAQQKQLASGLFGFNIDSIGFNFCVYLDLTFTLQGEEGKTYDLSIESEGKELFATTTIPEHAPLADVWFREPPGEPSDTLAQMICSSNDPAGIANFYRYQVEINGEGFVSSLASVIDDRIFDGEYFEFPLAKPEPRGTDDFDLTTFGLYRIGDMVTLKWLCLDEAHFNFWNTLEFGAANQGPFSNYTRVESNVEGGLGIWGGLSASYYDLTVEK
jgi:hypothetical protein